MITVIQHSEGQPELMAMAIAWNGPILERVGVRYVSNTEYKGVDGACPSEWARYDLVIMEAALAEAPELIWWFDADVLIENANIDLSWPLRVPESFGIDKPGNTGVFWVKTDADGLRLMRTLQSIGRDEPLRTALVDKATARIPELPVWRAWVAFDQIASHDTPERLGIHVHRFLNEWNYWQRVWKGLVPETSMPVQIRAWHGDKTKLIQMRRFIALGGRVLEIQTDPTHLQRQRVSVVQHGILTQSELMAMLAPWHTYVARNRMFNYLPNTVYRGQRQNDGRPGNWARYSLMLQAWDTADVIWWMDADAIIVNPQIDLSWPLLRPEYVGMDRSGNNGVFWVKTTPEARTLIEGFAQRTVKEIDELTRGATHSMETLLRSSPHRASGAHDCITYSAFSKHNPCLFGGEWNRWRKTAPIKGPIQIEALHGESAHAKMIKIKAITEALWSACA